MVKKEILLLTDDEVKQCITVKESVKLVEDSIKALGEGKAVESKFYLPIEKYEGFIKSMGCYYESGDVHMTKIFGLYPKNPQKFGMQTVNSTLVLTNPKNGLLMAVMDGDHITGLKTAGATAVAAKYLARKGSRIATIVGAGLQGRSHALAINEFFKLEEVRVADISEKARERYAQEMSKTMGIPVKNCKTMDEAVSGTDIVALVTTGNEPIMKAKMVQKGMFIAKVGSFQEMESEVITSVDKVVVDKWEYISTRTKEMSEVVKKGKFDRSKVYAEFPEVVAGKKPGRKSDSDSVVYLSLGFGVDNAALVRFAYDRALQKGLGRKVEL
jgi:ornithine cyclodeaminase/alanine dehydrogenase-like protein (mu-crystallin family)